MGKRYYWLKLKRDFFKRHDIKILEQIYGEKVLLFYLKLLVESVDHDGTLRFSEDVPYTADMIAVITDTDKDFAENALQTLEKLKIIETDKDGTIRFEKIDAMIGSAADNDNARRQQRFRDARKNADCNDDVTESVTNSNAEVTQTVTNSNESIENRDKRIEKRKKEKVKKEKIAFGSFQNVLLTEEEHERLLAKYGAEADEAIEYLSAYIIEKKYKSESHNLSIQRWVIDAVRERKAKQKKAPAKPNALNDTYARIAQFVEEVDE